MPASARAIVDGYADSLGLTRVYLHGNHDSRKVVRRVFGSGHFGPCRSVFATRAHDGDECAPVSLHNGLRIMTLDGVVPAAIFGSISTAQLARLRQVIQEKAPRGKLLTTTLHGYPILSKVGLCNGDRLEALRRQRCFVQTISWTERMSWSGPRSTTT